MGVNKVVLNTTEGEETLVDLTGDTVTPETLAEGVTAHDASGEPITGAMKAGGGADLSEVFDITTDDTGEKSYTLKEECLATKTTTSIEVIEHEIINEHIATNRTVGTSTIDVNIPQECYSQDLMLAVYKSTDSNHPLITKGAIEYSAELHNELIGEVLSFTLKKAENEDILGTGIPVSGYSSEDAFIILGQFDEETFTVTSQEGFTIICAIWGTLKFTPVFNVERTNLPIAKTWLDTNGTFISASLEYIDEYPICTEYFENVTINNVVYAKKTISDTKVEVYGNLSFILRDGPYAHNDYVFYLSSSRSRATMDGVSNCIVFRQNGEIVFAFHWDSTNTFTVWIRNDIAGNLSYDSYSVCMGYATTSDVISTPITIPEDKLPEHLQFGVDYSSGNAIIENQTITIIDSMCELPDLSIKEGYAYKITYDNVEYLCHASHGTYGMMLSINDGVVIMDASALGMTGSMIVGIDGEHTLSVVEYKLNKINHVFCNYMKTFYCKDEYLYTDMSYTIKATKDDVLQALEKGDLRVSSAVTYAVPLFTNLINDWAYVILASGFDSSTNTPSYKKFYTSEYTG